MSTVVDPVATTATGAADQLPLVDHLQELRHRLVIAMVAIAVGMVVAWLLYEPILGFLVRPYCHAKGQSSCRNTLLVTDPLEPLNVRIKVTFFAGLFLASPVVFWQLWRFITPGLTGRERRWVIPFVGASVGLFSLGALVAMATFPAALHFLITVGGGTFQSFFSPTKYLRLITLLVLAFGLAFEFPVVLVSLELAGVVTPRQLSSVRRWAVMVITLVAAVVTPSADPISMIAMAIPMYLLYELSILVGWAATRGRHSPAIPPA